MLEGLLEKVAEMPQFADMRNQLTQLVADVRATRLAQDRVEKMLVQLTKGAKA